MISVIVSITATVIFLYVLKQYHAFTRNLAAAKSSGIPYIIVPFYLYDLKWLVSQKLVAPYLRMLPRRLTEPWLDYIFEDWTWTHQYAGFQKAGHNTFLTVSPGGNILISADAAVINQITTRGREFPKPLKVYQVLNIYGTNVLSTEGQVWRQHRKITTAPFNEKNNHTVFAESLRQAQAMTDIWMNGKEESSPIHTVAKDVLRLSLHVISLAGFGRRLSWLHDESTNEGGMNLEKDGSHELSYTDSLTLLLENLIWLFVFSKSFLIYLPFKKPKLAYLAYTEWEKYLNEMFHIKKEDFAAGKWQEGLDLMGAMVGASLSESHNELSPSEHDKPSPTKPIISDSEIIGNSFVLILAGHETVANSIHFSLIYLALCPSSQRRLQADLDNIFGSRPVSDWEYDRDINQLFSGVCGAVLAEELRLIPPVINIPKSTAENSLPVPLVINGKTCHVPPNTYINVSATGVHRNPAFWPTGPPTDPAHPVHPTSNIDNDLEEFKPERWLLRSPTGPKSQPTLPHADDGALSHDSTPDTSTALFRPVRGAYIPFSDGQRSCLGRRFAQVEVLAVLAVIFKEYSLELAVDEFPTTTTNTSEKYTAAKSAAGRGLDALEALGEEGKKEAWEQAATEVRRMLRDEMGSVITIQLRKGHVPLRLVRRGRERFWW